MEKPTVRITAKKGDLANEFYRHMIELGGCKAYQFIVNASALTLCKSEDEQSLLALIIHDDFNFKYIEEFNLITVVDEDENIVPWEDLDVQLRILDNVVYSNEKLLNKSLIDIAHNATLNEIPLISYTPPHEYTTIIEATKSFEYREGDIEHVVSVIDGEGNDVEFMCYGGMVHVGKTYDRGACTVMIQSSVAFGPQGE